MSYFAMDNIIIIEYKEKLFIKQYKLKQLSWALMTLNLSYQAFLNTGECILICYIQVCLSNAKFECTVLFKDYIISHIAHSLYLQDSISWMIQ